MLRLFFWGPGKMPRQRLVGWNKSMACADPTTFYDRPTGHSCSTQIPSSYPRDFNLPNRTWLCSFHLDEKDSVVLAGLHSGDACRHRIDNGPVSFCPCHDRVEPCCVRRRFRSSFPQASSKRPRGFSGTTLTMTGREYKLCSSVSQVCRCSQVENQGIIRSTILASGGDTLVRRAR